MIKSLAFNYSPLWLVTSSPGFSCNTKKFTYSQEKISCFIPGFDPEGVVCVGIDVGGLNLEDVCWHSPVCLDAHVFVNNRRWETLTLSLRSADTATANTQFRQSLWNWSLWGLMKQKKKLDGVYWLFRGFGVRRLAGVSGIASEAPVIVPAHFIILAVMGPRLAFIYVWWLAEQQRERKSIDYTKITGW